VKRKRRRKRYGHVAFHHAQKKEGVIHEQEQAWSPLAAGAERYKQALGERSIMTVRPHVASDGIMTML
jgi:hypothetical protein